MCWTTFKTANKIIAEEDIPIFKVCVEASRISNDTVVCSYFKHYDYEINRIYTLSNRISPRNRVGFSSTNIDVGFHSYLASECKFERSSVFNQWVVLDKNSRYTCSYEGHSVRVSGYIPKGSEYYVNESGECVSNSICLTKIFK